MEQNGQKCYFCGSSEKPRDIGTHMDNGTEYTLRECPNCAAQYWAPFKNPGAEWYEKDERYAGRNLDPDIEANWHQKKTIDLLRPFAGRLLDVGCGAGTFMHWAEKMGWDAYGVDFDRDAIRTAKEVFGLKNAESADLYTFRKGHPDLKFDLITFFDVFEHLDDHHVFLGQIKAMLEPDGRIAMSMPYRGGARWLQPGDLPPRHLTRWNRSAISGYLEREGFEAVYIKRLPASINFLVSKLQRKYGRYFSFNIIGKLKAKARKDEGIKLGSAAEKNIAAAHKLAKIKDAMIFGLPALIIWLAMILSPKRYIGLFVMAKKKQQ